MFVLNKRVKQKFLNPLCANPTKWSNTLKQFVDKLPTNCLSVFGHFVILALNGLKQVFLGKNKKVEKILEKKTLKLGFGKVVVCRSTNFWKVNSVTDVFKGFCEKSLYLKSYIILSLYFIKFNNFFQRTPLSGCFWKLWKLNGVLK